MLFIFFYFIFSFRFIFYFFTTNLNRPAKQRFPIGCSIKSLRLQELRAHLDVQTDLYEFLFVQKRKSSIFISVKGMSEVIVTSISTAAFDILQEVFSNAVCQILQENETFKK